VNHTSDPTQVSSHAGFSTIQEREMHVLQQFLSLNSIGDLNQINCRNTDYFIIRRHRKNKEKLYFKKLVSMNAVQTIQYDSVVLSCISICIGRQARKKLIREKMHLYLTGPQRHVCSLSSSLSRFVHLKQREREVLSLGLPRSLAPAVPRL
jgi:hypothetical protein